MTSTTDNDLPDGWEASSITVADEQVAYCISSSTQPDRQVYLTASGALGITAAGDGCWAPARAVAHVLSRADVDSTKAALVLPRGMSAAEAQALLDVAAEAVGYVGEPGTPERQRWADDVMVMGACRETDANKALRSAAREYAKAWDDYKNESRKSAALAAPAAARAFAAAAPLQGGRDGDPWTLFLWHDIEGAAPRHALRRGSALRASGRADAGRTVSSILDALRAEGATEVRVVLRDPATHTAPQGPASDDGEGQAWLDDLVPPVEGGPRLTPAGIRQRLEDLERLLREKTIAVKAAIEDCEAAVEREATARAEGRADLLSLLTDRALLDVMDAEMVATGEGSDDVGEEAASRGLVHWHGDIPDGKELGSLTPKGRAARATPPHGGAEPLTSAAFVAAARGVLDRAAPDGDKAVILRWLVEDAAPAPHGGEAGPPEGCVVDAVPTGASGHAAPHVLHSLTRRDGGCKARSGIYRAGKFGGHVFTWSIDDSEWSTTPRDVAAYLLAYAAKHEASPLPKSEPTPRPDGLDELLDAVEAEIVAEEPAKPVDESEPVLMRWADERGGQCQSVFESSAEAEAFAKRERLTLWKVEPWKGGPAEPVDESGVERREVVAPTNDPESPDGSAHVVGGWEALYGPDTRPPAYHEARARAERLVPEAAPVDLTQARAAAHADGAREALAKLRRGRSLEDVAEDYPGPESFGGEDFPMGEAAPEPVVYELGGWYEPGYSPGDLTPEPPKAAPAEPKVGDWVTCEAFTDEEAPSCDWDEEMEEGGQIDGLIERVLEMIFGCEATAE